MIGRKHEARVEWRKPMDLTTLSMSEAAPLIAARSLSPVEWTQALLERTAKLDPLLNR